MFAAISAILPAMAECWPIGAPHWMRSPAHFRQISSEPFRQADARRRDREAAGVQSRQRDLQSLPFLRDQVLARHAHVREFHDAVVERAQAHEVAAIGDLEPGRIDIDDERA